MEFLQALWIPIVLSSVVLFFCSALAWTVLPHHKPDFRPVEKDEELRQTLRDIQLKPGRYVFPYMQGNPNEEPMKSKIAQGPLGSITIFPGITMGRNLALTYLFFLIASALLGYLGWFAMEGRADKSFWTVFRLLGTAGILTYTCSAIPNDIWFRRPFLTNLIDGIVYGLINGLIFAALWPR